MNTAQKRPPGFGPVPLFHVILFLQWQIRRDVDLCKTGHLVTVPGGEIQWINVQIVEHILNGYLPAELLEYQHVLTIVAVNGNPSFGSVIGDTSNISCFMLLIDSPRLACSTGLIEVRHFQGPVSHSVLFRRQGLPEQIYLSYPESEAGVIVYNFRGGQASPDILDKAKHLRDFFLFLGRQIAPFLKCSFHRGFRLVCLCPSALFSDTFSIFSCAPVCFLQVRCRESAFEGGKADG